MAAAPYPPSKLDSNQVLQHAYDDVTGRLRTDASATIINADIDVALDAAEDNVAIRDTNGDELSINADGSINIGASVLPTGAATSAKQDTQTTELQSINTELDTVNINLTNIQTEIDSSQYTINETFNKSIAIGGQFDDASITAATENNIAPIRITAQRALHTNIRDSLGGEITQDNPLPIRLGNTGDIDALGRLRTSNPFSVFENTFQYDIQPLFWSTSATNGGTIVHSANKATVDLSLTTASGDAFAFQTRKYFDFHPGRSQYVAFSFNFGGSQANCRRRIGQFDTNNGVFLALTGLVLSVVVRTKTSGSVVDTDIPQSTWNLDKLDGTGTSGFTLDTSLQQIFIVDQHDVGTGRIRFGFILGGKLVYVHQYLSSNVLSVPHAQTSTLPLRVEGTNTGTTSASKTMYLSSVALYTEGGFDPVGIARTISSGVTTKTIAASGKIPIISIRKNTAGILIPIRINGVSVFCDTVDNLLIILTINASFTGATFALTQGYAEADIAASAMTGGTEVYSFYLKGQGSGGNERIDQDIFALSNLILGSSFSSTSDIFTISASSLSGAAQAAATINFRELY